ncbi:MAG: efflux RND transporter periplasmic adaptor subunit [Verrucomicrobiota bacterium]
MKKLIFITVFLIASGIMTWLVWFRPVQEPGEEKKPEAEVPVHVATITRATLRRYVTAYGPVEPDPKASARVASAVPGVVAAVKCVEGERIEKGALLFQLDSRAADVAVAFAEKSVQRQQKLAKVDGTSQKALQDAEQALAAARAQQALLQVQSPLAGVVTKVNTKVGEAADLTTVLGEVVDLDRLVVSANVASTELANLQAGQAAEVIPADSTNVVSTSLIYASPQVDAKTGSGLVRALLPANSGLRPGQFAKLRIIAEEHKDCVAVPVASVAKDASGASFVALVDGEKAVLKPVKVGLRDGDLVEVSGEGLEADKTVVTEGAYGLIMTQQFATKIRAVND